MPFAERGGGADPRLSGRAWLLLLLAFVALHYLALLAATQTGNFDWEPNHDHVKVMEGILEQGYPKRTPWPPLYGYYMALQWLVLTPLGLPFWVGKFTFDLVPFVASGVLSTLLGLRLTANRFLGVASGLGLTAAPMFAMASAEGLAVLLFQPLFLGALLLLVRELQRDDGPDLVGTSLAGVVLGLATLVRANPQFLLVALAPWILWLGWRRSNRWRWALALAAAVGGQAVVLLPWAMVLRSHGQPAFFAAPVLYRTFVWGVARHDDQSLNQKLRESHRGRKKENRREGPRDLVDFHRRALRDEPLGLAKIYGKNLLSSWYRTVSGRWDRAIAILHAPLWALALVGLGLWLLRSRGDPALWLLLLVVGYMWFVAAVGTGMARYMAPIYGLLGLLAGIPLLRLGVLRSLLDDGSTEADAG